MSELKVLLPLSGRVWPLERVPDPVFAQKNADQYAAEMRAQLAEPVVEAA